MWIISDFQQMPVRVLKVSAIITLKSFLSWFGNPSTALKQIHTNFLSPASVQQWFHFLLLLEPPFMFPQFFS
jgi:hypothetical protein